MPNDKPQSTDAILGGQNPPPIDSAVLGGDIGRKQRIQHEKSVARSNKFWQNFEYLHGLPNAHATTFANRQVVDFEIGMDITNPTETAYAIRWADWHRSNNDVEQKMISFFMSDRANEVEALVFGLVDDYYYGGSLVNKFILENPKEVANTKAIFIGDIEDSEMMISSIEQGDVSYILKCCPSLEIFHTRGTGIGFAEQLRHEKLKALRIESGGLNREALTGLNRLELPSLEYLELWMGRNDYGGNSSIEDLMPIISGSKFPKLKYLGLRNCEYTDDVALAIAKSPIIEGLLDLDLSMGTLSDEALTALLQSPDINDLDLLNISQNYISANFIDAVLPTFELKCQVNIDGQQRVDYYNGKEYRYCVVGE